ncbi:MAG: hypothetical protein ACWGNO_02770, partial [Desulfobacterales bacterium]
NYGNAQPVKSKRRVSCTLSPPTTGLQLYIDNPGWPFIMAVSGWPLSWLTKGRRRIQTDSIDREENRS